MIVLLFRYRLQRRLTIGAVAIALFVITGDVRAQEAGGVRPTSATSTVRVVGEATVSAKPTRGEVRLGVVSQAKSAQAAAEDNARKIDRIVDGLGKSLGRAAEIKTVAYGVNPNMRYSDKGPPTIDGYTATNQIQVRTTDLTQIPKTIDLALKLGANEIQQLTFGLVDQAPVELQALQTAAAKARQRAQALAQAVGLRVVRIVEVAQGQPMVQPVHEMRDARMKLAAEAPETRIEPGSVEVTATVTMVVEVAPATK